MNTVTVAKKYGWEQIGATDPYLISFAKIIDGAPARINVWEGRRGTTVGTCLTHPKQGKTQLFRRWVTESQLEKIFKNPRWHSGKGYK